MLNFNLIKNINKLSFFFLFVVLFSGCTSLKNKTVSKKITQQFSSDLFKNHHTGFLLLNAENQDTIHGHNHQKYFVPASNTKIFTLFTALKLLPKQSPLFKYSAQNDTLFIEGTGNPTLFHSEFDDSKTLQFLKNHKNIAVHFNHFKMDRFGPGWAWEDYNYYYSPERSSMPMYGNTLTIFNSDSLTVTPTKFRQNIEFSNNQNYRLPEENTFFYANQKKDTVEIPFKIDAILSKQLLEEKLGKTISIVDQMPKSDKKVFYGIATDTILQKMMLESDNFFAEQLMVMASSTLADSLNFETAKAHILKQDLSDLAQVPRWVDGSGLSRYNLFTPESIVQVLSKLKKEISEERLYTLFPAGGHSGTLKDWFAGKPKPYIYAKTGSLGNIYCLSGYLLTKSGKTLVFSFMNNNFMHSSTTIKKEMENLFEFIRDTY
mgnify:CR=1 FL=1